jgi:hypothetical protein
VQQHRQEDRALTDRSHPNRENLRHDFDRKPELAGRFRTERGQLTIQKGDLKFPCRDI